MIQRLLAAIAAILVLVLLLDVLQRREARLPVTPARAPQSQAVVPTPRRAQPLPGSPVPVATVPVNTAPQPLSAGDIEERLSTRRRLVREGANVYIDSLLAHSDSTLVRWMGIPGRVLGVAFIPDTTVQGWTPGMLADARTAMARWEGNDGGVRLREVEDTATADVKVRWVAFLPDTAQAAFTSLEWGPDGIVRSSIVTLALHQRKDAALYPVEARQAVATHEFGHVLGLPHSGQRNDLMFGKPQVGLPSRRDQATLRMLYSLPPGSLKVPL